MSLLVNLAPNVKLESPCYVIAESGKSWGLTYVGLIVEGFKR